MLKNKMKFKNLKILLISILFVNLSFFVNAKSVPESFADLAEKLTPSVVYISTTQTVVTNVNPFPFEFPPGSPFEDMFKEFGTPQTRKASALGSGFIIDSKGIVITNNHVIKGAEDILVRVEGDKEYKAKVLGADPLSDIAVLKIESKEKLTTVKFGDSDKARVGDWTIAIGNPLGLGGTVTAGIVSAISRDIGNGPYVKFIQTDASINRGNSGGPLFNIRGEVIGINTAIISQTGGSIGLGFAIPSNSAIKIVEQLKEFGRTKRGWLGVQITPVSKEIAESLGLPDEKGAFISNINLDGPSKAAGLQEGDVILKFNNNEIYKMTDLPRVVAESDVGSTAIIEIWRKNKLITIQVTLGELPEESYVVRKNIREKKSSDFYLDSLNLTISSTNDKQGVLVIQVDEESSLQIGDIITEVNRELVTNANNFIELIETIKKTGRNSLLLRIIRDDKSLWITIQFLK